MRRIALLLVILLLPTLIAAQKTVKVREYRRKDGTVVRAHERRAPRSTATASPVYSDNPQSSEPVEIEPYEVIDLGSGSFYTPGGTGITRPRRVFNR